MSTHNICFCGEIRKILCEYPLLSGAMDMVNVLKFWTGEKMNPVHHSDKTKQPNLQRNNFSFHGEIRKTSTHFNSLVRKYLGRVRVVTTALVLVKVVKPLKCQAKYVADDIQNLFIFQRKQVFTYHINHLPSRQFTWNVKTCFFWKMKKKNNKKLSSVACVIGILRV